MAAIILPTPVSTTLRRHLPPPTPTHLRHASNNFRLPPPPIVLRRRRRISPYSPIAAILPPSSMATTTSLSQLLPSADRHPNNNAASFLPYVAAPSSAADFVLPTLRSSFDNGLLHPHYDSIRAECDAWLLSGAASPSSHPTQRQALVDSLLPLLVCRMIPFSQASPRRLVLVSKILTWMTLDDDDLDNPDALGSDVAANLSRVDEISAVVAEFSHLDSRSGATNRAAANRKQSDLLRSLRHIWSFIILDMPPSLYSRFHSSFLNHLRAANIQAALRSSALLPADFESYGTIRRPASAFSILFPLAEYATGVELDETTYGHPLLEGLREAAMDHMWVCNDLVSCKVELAAGDRFNLPSVLYNGGGGSGSFQAAVDAAARIAHELDARCAELSEAICGSLPEAAAYATLITTCAAGMLSWSLQSSRYRNHQDSSS